MIPVIPHDCAEIPKDDRRADGMETLYIRHDWHPVDVFCDGDWTVCIMHIHVLPSYSILNLAAILWVSCGAAPALSVSLSLALSYSPTLSYTLSNDSMPFVPVLLNTVAGQQSCTTLSDSTLLIRQQWWRQG